VRKEVQEPDSIKQAGVCIVVQGEVRAAPEGAKQKIEVHAEKVRAPS